MKASPLLLAAFAALLPVTATQAAEGGGSVYLQGTFNDFAVAMPLPPAVYVRNDLIYYNAEIKARPLGGQVDAGLEQTMWLDMVKLSWVTDWTLMGGTYSAALVLPVVLDVDVDARLAGPGFGVFGNGSSSGFADPYLVPIQVNWQSGRHNMAVALGVSVPVGKYDPDDAVNLGRHYWAVDPNASYSWLHESGWEVSGTAGMLFNARNPDTDYRTGNEFHLDWLVAKHPSATSGFGVAGYWYHQTTDDDGNIAPFLDSGFRGRSYGIGPVFMKAVRVGEQDLSLIGKWLHDLDSERHMEGDLVMFGVALAL